MKRLGELIGVNKMMVDKKGKLRASLLNPVALVGESEEADWGRLADAIKAHIRAHGAKSAASALASALEGFKADLPAGGADLIRSLTRFGVF